MKKILVVTYYWPPYGGTGVYRILKFVKYLRQFGYEPIILTAEKADAPIYDELLLNEVPEGVETFHSKIWEPTTFFRKNVAEGEAAKVTTTVFQKEQSSFKMRLEKVCSENRQGSDQATPTGINLFHFTSANLPTSGQRTCRVERSAMGGRFS